MKELISKDLCTSCSACMSVCPKNCIEMLPSSEGFLYPVINDNCINCGLCKKVCPVINQIEKKEIIKQKSYAAVSKSNEIWRRSSSGGAFSEICLAWGDDQTLVCGAAWDGLEVAHICVYGVNHIAKLCKSKYVASDMKDCFREIKLYLNNGGKALFCGTPCQVAGLKNFLGKEYPNLLLIDLICHGVGSPYVFKECIKVIEEDIGENISSYEFRSKNRVYDTDHITKITPKKRNKPVYLVNDRYMQLFIKQDCLRASCGKNCKFRKQNREGDITIGDFKGIFSVFPELIGAKKNYSTIVVNNNKGEKVLEQLAARMELRRCDIEDIKKYNPLFYRHTYFSKEREQFFKEFNNHGCEIIRKKTVPANIYKKNIKGKIYNVLPFKVRNFIDRRRKENNG